MAFIDWIKNRNAAPQQGGADKSQQQKPETAKQMYAREAAQEKAGKSSVDQMPPEQKAKAQEIGAKMEQATRPDGPGGNSPAPAGGAASPEAMRQNMTGQERSAPALSPTGAHAGKTAQETPSQPAKEPPAKTQDTPQSRPQTLPRRGPSWER